MASDKHDTGQAKTEAAEPDEALIRRILTRATRQFPPDGPSPRHAKADAVSGDGADDMRRLIGEGTFRQHAPEDPNDESETR